MTIRLPGDDLFLGSRTSLKRVKIRACVTVCREVWPPEGCGDVAENSLFCPVVVGLLFLSIRLPE